MERCDLNSHCLAHIIFSQPTNNLIWQDRLQNPNQKTILLGSNACLFFWAGAQKWSIFTTSYPLVEQTRIKNCMIIHATAEKDVSPFNFLQVSQFGLNLVSSISSQENLYLTDVRLCEGWMLPCCDILGRNPWVSGAQ